MPRMRIWKINTVELGTEAFFPFSPEPWAGGMGKPGMTEPPLCPTFCC